MKKRDLYKQIVRRYMENTASDREREIFFHLLREGELEKYLEERMMEDAVALTGRSDTDGKKVIPLRPWYWAAAAVAILAISVIAITKLGGRHKEIPDVAAKNYFKNDVAPGGNKAILTLADGTRVALDSLHNRHLAQGNSLIQVLDSGNVDYTAKKGMAVENVFNSLSTPRGGQYQLILSDGTKVWLNSLSSVRFPTDFNGPERTVELIGEGYFEVARDPRKPFHVLVRGMDVAVLGTDFNINAYADEGYVRTTLVEGAVQLMNEKGMLVLKPGEQGRTIDGKGFALVPHANVAEAVAWKNGLFSFDNAGIETVMRQLSRWYGVEVRYEGRRTTAVFWGKMGRDLNLTQVLKGLSTSKVHFHLDGNILTVLP